MDIVVPVYNEEAGLERSVRRLHHYLTERFPLPWLITIADNASTDGTWSIAAALTDELDGVGAIHLEQKGRGRALRTAWTASPAPVVAYMDVDLSTDLAALLPLVAPLVSGHSDVAIGSRLAPAAHVARGPRREAISRTYNRILRTSLRAGFSDAQCGFKALRSDAARLLLPLVEDQGWFFDTELLVLAEHNGMRIHEVPVDWVDDPDSRVDVTATAIDDLKGVVRTLRRLSTGDVDLPCSVVPSRHGEADPDLPSQLVRFASIGVVSTILFGLLFVIMRGTLGPGGSDVAALGLCAMANTAANRRLTFAVRGRADRRQHYLIGLGLSALPLAMTLFALWSLDLMGVHALVPQVAVLTVCSALAAAVRFRAMRAWAPHAHRAAEVAAA